jgi:DNA-binding NarL/FixJ family response regulator
LLDALKELYHGGAPMSPQISRRVIETFRTNKKPLSKDKENKYNLSRRELEILELMSAGYRNKEIAEKLFISSHTVRSHIYNIYEKLHVQSRVEALNKLK